MTKHLDPTGLNRKVSRRQAMIGAASLSFAVAFSGRAGAAALDELVEFARSCAIAEKVRPAVTPNMQTRM